MTSVVGFGRLCTGPAQNFESQIYIMAAKIFLLCFFLHFLFRRCIFNTQGPYALGPCDDMGPKSSDLPSVVTNSYYNIDVDIVHAIEPWL